MSQCCVCLPVDSQCCAAGEGKEIVIRIRMDGDGDACCKAEVPSSEPK